MSIFFPNVKLIDTFEDVKDFDTINKTESMDNEPPTNSKQINSLIKQILDNNPGISIYLFIQSSTGRYSTDREMADKHTAKFNYYIIQDKNTNTNIDSLKGSCLITVNHGTRYITGGVIDHDYTNQINANFPIKFVQSTGAKKVSGADDLTEKTNKSLPSIVKIVNKTKQIIAINSYSGLSGTGSIDPKSKGKGLMNGKIDKYILKDFGRKRIKTVVESLLKAGINSSYIKEGDSYFFRNKQNTKKYKSGTFIELKIEHKLIKNGTYKGATPVKIDLKKLQIY